jgi:DNA-binding HxlR family transcriptional regulator
MEKTFRSSCLIASVRDMLLQKKKTFKEMAASDEGVASNLLSQRLKLLESLDVITKQKLPHNQKENIYLLTEKGIELAPIILEIVLWSDKYVRAYHPDMNPYDSEGASKASVIANVQQGYRAFADQVMG